MTGCLPQASLQEPSQNRKGSIAHYPQAPPGHPLTLPIRASTSQCTHQLPYRSILRPCETLFQVAGHHGGLRNARTTREHHGDDSEGDEPNRNELDACRQRNSRGLQRAEADLLGVLKAGSFPGALAFLVFARGSYRTPRFNPVSQRGKPGVHEGVREISEAVYGV